MAKVAGYLEQRRAGFSAVVDVPPSKREAVGSKRLKKGLGTRDKHVAKARLAKALLELHARIDAACRRNADTDPMTVEAMAYREQMESVSKPGGGVYEQGTYMDPGTGTEQTYEVEIAEDLIRDTIEARGDEIAAEEGRERAKAFADIAMGRATPLKLHVETWLSEPGKRGTVRAPRTVMEYRAILETFALWLGGEGGGSTVEGVSRVVAGRYVSSLHKQNLSPARMRDILAALSTYWAWLEARGFARRGSNPWKEQDIPKVQKAQALKAVTGDDDEDDSLRPFSDDELVKRNHHMTLHSPLRAPVPGTDERGRRVYRVPLAKVGVSAIVDVDDYDALITSGVSGSWSWCGGTVVVGSREENTRRVARLIMNPPAGHQVRHRNRNALDLRRDNLFLKQIRPRSKPTFTGQHRPL